jgi:SAM-dependent methyltransferase
MNAIQRSLDIWRRSALVASRQSELARCPCCHAGGAGFLFDANDLASHLFVDRRLARGRYSLCANCGIIFAAVRPKPEVAAEYYALFSELEEKNHDVYPPPSRKSRGKLAIASELIAKLDSFGLLKPGMAVLHVRCDAGILLKALRERVPDATLHGLDYFETNVRYLNEQDFASAAILSPGGIELPWRTSYDLIFANHHFTHSLDPRADLARLAGALKPGGRILFYNEVDHAVLFDPENEHFTRLDVINFHKQLFVRDTFESFLRHAGFAFEYLGHRTTTMSYLGAPAANAVVPGAVAPDFLDREKRMFAAWQGLARRSRYPIAIMRRLRPLLRWTGIDRKRPRKSSGDGLRAAS